MGRLVRWSFPSHCGDFRLKEAVEPGHCVLHVVNPIASEVALLRPYLEELRQRKLVDPLVGISMHGHSEIEIATPLTDAGALLWQKVTGGRGTLTAVAAHNGAVTATFTTPDEDLSSTALAPPGTITAGGGAGSPPSTEVAERSAFRRLRAWIGGFFGGDGDTRPVSTPSSSTALATTEPAAAVTVTRPYLAGITRGDCPETLASEVLRSFSTPAQWATWSRGGWMEVVGHASGHTYRLAHRKSAMAARQGRVALDCDDGLPLHAFNWLLPPPEEVLAIKLYLEHAEAWVRNPAGVDEGATDVFEHPMGGHAWLFDGQADQRFLESLGAAIRQLTGAPSAPVRARMRRASRNPRSSLNVKLPRNFS